MPDLPTPEDLAVEMTTAPPLEVVFKAMTLFEITALIQLALRHPGLSGRTRDLGTWFVAIAAAHFETADCPAIRQVILAGDNPAYDRGRQR
jgi:hypothetical protein